MTRKWYLKVSMANAVRLIFASLIVSFLLNEFLVSTLESNTIAPSTATTIKLLKESLANKTDNPDLEEFSVPFHHHPIYFPTTSDGQRKPSIVLSRGYKRYLHGFQKFVKGIMTKVSKVNQSVGKFFSKFKRNKNEQTKQKSSMKEKNVKKNSMNSKKERHSDSGQTEVSVPSINDHIEMDISLLKLEDSQVALLHSAYTSALQSNDQLQLWADETHFIVSPHLAYRYYISVDWSDNYNEHSVDKAIIETVQWRKEFGIGKMNTSAMTEYVEQGLAYTSNVPDKYGRSVIYLKLGKYSSSVTARDFLNLVMYTVERADRMSVGFGSGEFVTVMDFEGFSWSSCPPIAYLKEAISLLRMHYPYRLAGIYILNTSGAFNFIWSLLTPFLPRKALAKTVMIPKHDVKRLLPNLIGIENLEESYGGLQKDANSNVDEYFANGYWSSIVDKSSV